MSTAWAAFRNAAFFAAALPAMERAAVTILRRRIDPLRPELSPRVANEIGAGAARHPAAVNRRDRTTPALSPETVRQRRGGFDDLGRSLASIRARCDLGRCPTARPTVQD